MAGKGVAGMSNVTYLVNQRAAAPFEAACGCLVQPGSWYYSFSTGSVMCELHGSDSIRTADRE